MKSRVFNIMQYVKHPKTGETLLTEQQIHAALGHKSIKDWAYILHDKDTWTAQDEADDADHVAGQTKPAHWHIVLRVSYAADTSVIAKWFGIPENFVDCPKGAGAFLDCTEYITHEDGKQQAIGKHHYTDEEVHANFDFRTALTERAEKRAKYGRDLSERDELRHKVLYEGMTIRQVIDADPLAYQNDYATLDKFRYKYITDRAPMPTTRINYYVCGRGGLGKGLICKALARSLYPQYKEDDDIFFEVGAKGAAFDGYDGQPVIIWNDRRAYDLLQELGGRQNVFNVFETHPTRQRQNVKYGSVCLCNAVNIVNSVQPYAEFLDGLVGAYTDKNGYEYTAETNEKSQSYRRFPFIIPLHEDDFDLLMNKGFYKGTREYEQYIEYKHIRGNMEQIAIACGNNAKLAHELQGQAVSGVVKVHHELVSKLEHDAQSEDEIRKQFADVGTMKTPDEE